MIALRAAGDLAETDPASARAVYVGALGSERDRGVLWRLGDLARSEGDVVEAAEWYRLALQGDTQPEAEPAAVAGIAADPNGEPARIDRAEGVR